MATSFEQTRLPDSIIQRGSNELIKLIRKLRWVGMDEEAERLQAELTRRDAETSESVIAMSRDTD